VKEFPSKKLLFLTGDKRREVLPQKLREGQVPFEELCVYETETIPNLRERLEEHLGDRDPEWLAFFSPSGAAPVMEALEQMGRASGARLAAIGPTTRAALLRLGYSVSVSPSQPSLSSLAQEIKRLEFGS